METYTHSTRSSIVANILVAIAPKNNTEEGGEQQQEQEQQKQEALFIYTYHSVPFQNERGDSVNYNIKRQGQKQQ